MKILRFSVAAAIALMLGVTIPAQAQGKVTPRGTYMMVTDSAYAGPDLAGVTLKFEGDDTMTVTAPDGSLIVKTKLSFADGVMTLTDQDGTNVCQYAGKYKLVGDEKTFRMTLVEDGCGDRAQIVTAVKFVRTS